MTRTVDDNQQLSSPEKRYDARIPGNASAAALQTRIVEKELQNLHTALDRVTVDGATIRAAALTVGARRRFVLGVGKSFAYATLLAADLSTGLSQVSLIAESISSAVELLLDVKETDVLIVFSFRRYRRSAIEIATSFVERGGTLVLITDGPSTPLSGIASETIVVSTDSASYSDSPTAVAAVIHLLSTLTTSSSKGARRRLSDRDELGVALRLYLD